MQEDNKHKQGKVLFKNPFIFAARTFFVVVFVVSLSFSVGYFYGYSGFKINVSEFPKVNISRDLPPEKQTLDFSLFWRVWDTIHTRYFEKTQVVDSKLVYGAIRGMVAAVGDPYTVFLPPNENKIVQEDLQGNFEGVGIQIGFKGTQLVVIAPLPGSPAEEAGVRAGDLIIGIVDERKGVEKDTAGITLPEAVEDIRGPANSKVILILMRDEDEDPIRVEIVRANIDVPSVIVDYVGDDKKIAHVSVLKFSGETLSEWEEVVAELLIKKDLSGIIMDVRNNPGGFLEQSVELASDFLKTGSVVVIEEDGGGIRQEYRVEKLGRFRNTKVVVLVNEGSASASEIFAGALRDNIKTSLIGMTTFGKGTIQESQQVNSGSGLHITVAKWLTPSGFWVNDGGLVPDVVIEDDISTEEDEQLLGALEELRKN